MTELIAQLKQMTVGEGIFPSQMNIVTRVAIAFTIGVIVAAIFV